MSLKKVEISIGLIKLQSSLICIRRNKAPYKNFIEFPGGKIKNNETPMQCLRREIKEELNIEIDKSKFKSSPKVKTKIKISNIDMNIVINKNKIKSTNKGLILNRKKIVSEVIPSFTKKLFRVASSNV